MNLRKHAIEYGRLDEYDVSYEATHHGPTGVEKPLCFIEIGSTMEEWIDNVNREVVALAVVKFLSDDEKECTPVLGVGGGHYPRKHTKKAFNNAYCYGHIFAKYAVPYLNRELIVKGVERSMPKPIKIVVEKKGTRLEQRKMLENLVLSMGLDLEYI